MPEVKSERSGWRDPELFPRINKGSGVSSGWEPLISARHRTWGWDCPAVDIDFLLIYDGYEGDESGMILLEYNYGMPKAIIEYKVKGAPPPSSKNSLALKKLGERAKIPVFLTYYTSDFSEFVVSCLTGEYPTQTLDEDGYKHFMAEIREFK